MKQNIKMIFLFTSIFLFFLACAPQSLPALTDSDKLRQQMPVTVEKPAWQQEWDKTLSLLEKKGKLSSIPQLEQR